MLPWLAASCALSHCLRNDRGAFWLSHNDKDLHGECAVSMQPSCLWKSCFGMGHFFELTSKAIDSHSNAVTPRAAPGSMRFLLWFLSVLAMSLWLLVRVDKDDSCLLRSLDGVRFGVLWSLVTL